jgi:Zn-dependent oligopeptidase
MSTATDTIRKCADAIDAVRRAYDATESGDVCGSLQDAEANLYTAIRDTVDQQCTVPNTARDEAQAKLLSTVDDVLSHLSAWTGLLQETVAYLQKDPEADPGDSSHAQHELEAMRRDFGKLKLLVASISAGTLGE